MRNASRAFGFLTRNSSWTRRYILVFQTYSVIIKKGKRVRYAGRISLLSIFKDTADMN